MYHLFNGRECVMASQFLCTSKSVDLLEIKCQYCPFCSQGAFDLLCREQQDLECSSYDGALPQGRVMLDHLCKVFLWRWSCSQSPHAPPDHLILFRMFSLTSVKSEIRMPIHMIKPHLHTTFWFSIDYRIWFIEEIVHWATRMMLPTYLHLQSVL